MKSEKLNALKNKMVEYNQPDGQHLKGFLQKDKKGFYIKTVEDISGSAKHGEDIRLNEASENFVTHAAKPKLMKVSMKSWHYSLVKYVLGSSAPTPQTLQNGCPYFWILMFSLIAVTFKVIGIGLLEVIILFPKMFFSLLEYSFNSWVDSVDENALYSMTYTDRRIDMLKIPLTSKMYLKHGGNKYGTELLSKFITKKYSLEWNSEEYNQRYEEIRKKWDAWYTERAEINRANNLRQQAEYRAHEKKRRIAKERWEAGILPYVTAIDGLFTAIENYYKEIKSWKNLIKRTKQTVGVIVTALLLWATYVIVSLFSYALMYVIDACITNWVVFVALGLIVAAAGIIYLLYIFVRGWLDGVVSKYKFGKKVWYIEPFIWTLYYPLKYTVMGIVYAGLYVIVKPLIFIFYKFIFKIILVSLGKLLLNIGRGILGSTGIFGEYFQADYSQYCPGLEWTDTEEQ